MPETVVVDESNIAIRSLNGRAVVTAGGADDHVFNITGQTNVTLEGFTIRDASGTSKDVAGIYMNNASGCNVSNNVVTNITATGSYNAYGINIANSNNNTLDPTVIQSVTAHIEDAYGILLFESDDNTFDSTSVSNITADNARAFGIALDDSNNNTFNSNTSVSNLTASSGAWGIYLADSDNVRFNSSTSVSNLTAGVVARGISFAFADNNNFDSSTSVFNLFAVDAYGIDVDKSSNNKFTANTFISDLVATGKARGIDMHQSSKNEFFDCTISDLTTAGGDIYGVYMSDWSDNNTISGGRISSHLKYGVYMQNCSDDFILDSEISDCKYGIYIDDKSAHTISGKTIYGNEFGVYLLNTWDNKIWDNEIRDNSHGVWLEDTANISYNNTILRNMIVNNSGHTGVDLTDGSYDNEVHQNCFIDNIPQARDDGSGNNWDGNYWSDYAVEGGTYNILGAAGSKDHNTLGICPLQPPPTPPRVPAMNHWGIVGLISLFAGLLVWTVRRRQQAS